MNFSYWERQFITDKADLVIIGGGISGLSAAYFSAIKFPNWKILVLEKHSISTAASTRNAGFSCFGSAGELMDDIKHSDDLASVFTTLQMRFEGLNLLKETLGEDQISYKNCGGTELFSQNQKEESAEILKNLDFINGEIESRTGLQDTFIESDVPDKLYGFTSAIFNKYEGKLNPGFMMRRWRELCEAKGIKILYGVKAELLDESNLIKVQNHVIEAGQIAICSNGLTKELGLDLDVKPARNLVLLTEPLPKIQLPSTYHHLQGYMYFRTINDRILLGGGRHLFKNEEESGEFLVNSHVKEYLHGYLAKHFQIDSSQVDQEWTGIMGVSDSKETIIKRLDQHKICGVRLGGMGVAIGSLVGKKVAELL